MIDFIAIGGVDILKENPNSDYSLPFMKEFVLQNKEAMLIDTCFFLLNSLCKNFNNSKHFKIIKSTVQMYYREFLYVGNNSDEGLSYNTRLLSFCKEELVADKISFFLGLYAESLFLELSMISDKNPVVILSPGFEDILKRSISYLFTGLMNFNTCQGTSYQCCFSLKALLSISVLKPYYDNYFGNIFDKLVQGIKEIELYPYFDLLIEILTRSIKSIKKVDTEEEQENDPNKLANQIAKDYLELANKRPFNYLQVIEITKSCVDRILKEIKSNTQNFTILSKCMNILIILSESYLCKDDYIPDSEEKRMLNANEFEVLVSSITSYMKNPNKINFDSEIVDYISNAQKFSSVLLESSLLIYDNLEKILVKNQNITKGLYDLIVNVLDKGQTYLAEKYNSQINSESTIEVHSEKNNCFDELIRLVTQDSSDYETENSNIFCILILQKLLHVSNNNINCFRLSTCFLRLLL